jgi:hypothetical protein
MLQRVELVYIQDATNIEVTFCKSWDQMGLSLTYYDHETSDKIVASIWKLWRLLECPTLLSKVWHKLGHFTEDIKTLEIWLNTYIHLGKTSGSHDCEYEAESLMGYNAVHSRRSRPTFQKCVLTPSTTKTKLVIMLIVHLITGSALKSRSNRLRVEIMRKPEKW